MQVVVLGNWSDFYAFNAGGLWYISLIVVNGTAYLFASFLWEANRYKRKSRAHN